MDEGFNYDTRRSIVILLAEEIFGENFHDFSIESIYRITTLSAFKISEKYIWYIIYKSINSVNLQIHCIATLN